MTDDKSISVVNLGELSKPADTLIKKVSSAIGGIFAPWQIKRLAKAEADLIKARTEIEITDLHRRAMHRFVEEEARRQQNMEAITERALPKLDSRSDPSKMEDDWVTNFFDRSRIVSDEDMQELWARILAGEANAPGSYSKRTVNALSDLDKRDAELFLTLCGFVWFIGGFAPLIFESKALIYNEKGINFNTLSHLDSIGLVQFSNITEFSRTGLPKDLIVSYCGKPLILKMPNENNNNLSIGKVLLTRVGLELASVCQAPEVDGFFDYVKEKWSMFLTEAKGNAQEASHGIVKTEDHKG